MRHPDLDLLFESERRKDEMRAADHARLVKEARLANQATTARPARFTFRPAALTLSRALAFVGQLLLSWSERLQCRYRVLASPENQPEPC